MDVNACKRSRPLGGLPRRVGSVTRCRSPRSSASFARPRSRRYRSRRRFVLGALDVHGDILPVFDLRQRFRLRERPLDPSDHFLLARAGRRTVVLVIDQPLGVVDHSTDAIIDADALAPDLAHVRGVLRLPDGLVVIQDLEALLSAEESLALDVALARVEVARNITGEVLGEYSVDACHLTSFPTRSGRASAR